MFVTDLNTGSVHPFDFCVNSYCQVTVFILKLEWQFNVFKIWSLGLRV